MWLNKNVIAINVRPQLLNNTRKRYSTTGGRNIRKNKNKKTIQKLISVASED